MRWEGEKRHTGLDMWFQAWMFPFDLNPPFLVWNVGKHKGRETER